MQHRTMPHGAVRHHTVLSFVRGVELFGNIFAASNSIGTWKVCIKFLAKIYGVLREHMSQCENCRTTRLPISIMLALWMCHANISPGTYRKYRDYDTLLCFYNIAIKIVTPIIVTALRVTMNEFIVQSFLTYTILYHFKFISHNCQLLTLSAQM